ncbi:hypothetical protein [Elusimicrobium minutum]|nr:hypothetical protein [Elusimicrobium minutum]
MPELFFYLIVLMVFISAVFKTFKIMFIGSLAGIVTMLFKWGAFSSYVEANPGIGLHSHPFPVEIIFILLIVIFIVSFTGLAKQKNDNDNTGKTEKPQ